MSSSRQAIRLTIPAKAEYVRLTRLALTGLLRTQPVPEETVADLKLALTEACSNSVRHAYRDGQDEGEVEIVFDLHPDRVVIEVVDSGPGFTPEQWAQAEREELSESGLGIAIIRALADELELGERENGGGSRLRIVKRLS
jgi:serine/threonine-protein kinase RsbW